MTQNKQSEAGPGRDPIMPLSDCRIVFLTAGGLDKECYQRSCDNKSQYHK